MRRGAKVKKSSRNVNLPIRGAVQLPKYIRDNIRHPLLRLGWFTELNGAGSMRF
jgi:hypothetical protein